jgi:hypothetical protein
VDKCIPYGMENHVEQQIPNSVPYKLEPFEAPLDSNEGFMKTPNSTYARFLGLPAHCPGSGNRKIDVRHENGRSVGYCSTCENIIPVHTVWGTEGTLSVHLRNGHVVTT